jgi:hypothetical protein
MARTRRGHNVGLVEAFAPLITDRDVLRCAVVVEPHTDRPVGVLSTLDVAGILGWGRG